MTNRPLSNTSILACVDGSTYTDSVCAHTAWASQRLHAPVQLLHVQPPHTEAAAPLDLSGAIGLGERSALLEKLTQLDEARGKLDLQKGKLILDHAKEQLTASGISGITTLHRRGSLIETIHEFEASTQLVVLGKRGEHADYASLHLGSNLERVVRSTHKPVLVAARAFKTIHRVGIAFDGGPSTMKAIDYLATMPLLREVECHLLKVGPENGENRRSLEGAAIKLGQNGITVQTRLFQGDADDLIADFVKSKDLNLLVMGAYGHSHIRTLIIGSTTNTMLRSCPIPILLFR